MQSSSIDYIHALLSAYPSNPSIEDLVKLHSLLNTFLETNALEKYLHEKLDSNLYRVLATYLQKKVPIENVIKNSILIRGLEDKIDLDKKNDDLGNSALDHILFSKFEHLTDKITLFEKASKADKKSLEKALKYILVISYVVDKNFYAHLESLILKVDDVQYFPQRYSFNPYIANSDSLNDAVSHLLNITVKIDINETKELLKKYSSITNYKCVNTAKGIIHPIFYLIENKMWKILGDWIQNEPHSLKLSDNNSISLISRILVLSHGYIKGGGEHDMLFDLQKKVIDVYYKTQQTSIFPQIDLFLAYLEYEKNLQLNKNTFTRMTVSYYKSILEYFIEIDHQNKNTFLSSSCPDNISLYTLLLNSGYRIEIGFKAQINKQEIIVYNEQISELSDVIKFDELYFSILKDKKISIHTDNILNELEKNIILFNGIRCQELFPIMIDDYLDLKYSNDFVGKLIVQNQIHHILTLIAKSKYFSASEFIEKYSKSFDILCKMAEYEIIRELKIDSNKEQTIKIIVENAINAVWFSNSDKSDSKNAEKFCLTAIHLNIILSRIIHEEKIIRLSLSSNKIQQQISYYLNLDIHGCKTDICPELKIKFSDGGFKVIGNSKRTNYIKLYNFTSILFAKLFNWLDISNDILSITYKEETHTKSLFKSVYDLILSDNQNTILQGKTNLDNIEQAIHICLIHLSDSKQNTLDYDLKQEELQNLFRIILKTSPDHKIIQDANNPTSELWSQIRMLGSTRSKHLFDFFLNHRGKILNDTIKHHIQCTVNRSIRHSAILGDLQGVNDWLQYGLNILDNTTPTKVTSLKNIPDNAELVLIENDISSKSFSSSSKSFEKSLSISSDDKNKLHKSPTFDSIRPSTYEIKDLLNSDQTKLIHNALITAIGAVSLNTVKLILNKYPDFLINYKKDNKEIELFSIIREHSESKMMELPIFKESLSKITVILLEHGYPIDLIEMHNRKNCKSFISSILIDQLKYSAIQTTINWCSAIPFLPNITQGIIAARYYMNIYEKSLNYFLEFSEDKIDISNFCPTFSSIFQSQDFKNRIKSISFFNGIKDDFSEAQLIANARITFKVIRNINDSKKRTNYEIKLRQLCNTLIKSGDSILNQPSDEEISYKQQEISSEKEDFLILRHRTSTKYLEKITSIEVLKKHTIIQEISASFITGTFIYINNEYGIRDKINALLPLISTTTVAASTVLSGIKNFIDMISPITLYLVAAGTTAYVAYDVYKKYSQQQSIMFDLDSIQKFSTKFYKAKQRLHLPHSEKNVYEFIKSLFNNCIGKEFVSQDTFFSIMRRFDITSGDLFTEIENLKHINENTSFFFIADALTLVSAYVNAKHIKNILPSNQSNEAILIEVLQHFMSGEVKQLRTCMFSHNIGDLYNKHYEELRGCEILMHHYEAKSHDQYIWTLKNSHLIDEQTKNKLMKNSFFKFIFELSKLSIKNCDKSQSAVENAKVNCI